MRRERERKRGELIETLAVSRSQWLAYGRWDGATHRLPMNSTTFETFSNLTTDWMIGMMVMSWRCHESGWFTDSATQSFPESAHPLTTTDAASIDASCRSNFIYIYEPRSSWIRLYWIKTNTWHNGRMIHAIMIKEWRFVNCSIRLILGCSDWWQRILHGLDGTRGRRGHPVDQLSPKEERYGIQTKCHSAIIQGTGETRLIDTHRGLTPISWSL